MNDSRTVELPQKKLAEVELPCCPECGLIGKRAANEGISMKSFCTGPKGKLHKRARLIKRRFREVEGQDHA